MFRLLCLWAISALSIFPAIVFGQSAAIQIDGSYSDWTPSLAGYTDPVESISGIDLLDFQVSNDANYLYVRVAMDTEIDLTDVLISQSLYLYIDADNNSSTGYSPTAGFGSECGIHFPSRTVYYDVVPSSVVGFSDIGLVCLPTVSSTEFEIAIRRDAVPDGVVPLFSSDTIRLLFRESNGNDFMPNTGGFSYTFDNSPVPAYTTIDLEKDNADHLRMTAYNVKGGMNSGTVQNALDRVLNAIDPDIIGFSEASNVSATTVKNLMDSWLPLGTPDGWFTVKDDYDLITASRFPITDDWPSLDRQHPVLIDLPATYPSDILLVNAHLSCCANETGRQAQADEFVNFVLDAKTAGGQIDLPEGTPIVLGGDLNLVGYAQQLNTLLNGDIQNTGTWGPGGFPDWDNTPLTDLICLQTDQAMAITWEDAGSAFPPGRLDFLIYSDASITAEKAYTLNPGVMSPTRLSFYGLQENDGTVISDHYPVTGDFSFAEVADTDGDGVVDPVDNCVDVANADQADFNNDGIGDACQDSDGDGLADADEINIWGTSPTLQDSDGDGITDWAELNITLTDPMLVDTDGDGCNDLEAFGGLCGPICIADLNNDGTVEVSDLLIILQYFGTPCGE